LMSGCRVNQMSRTWRAALWRWQLLVESGYRSATGSWEMESSMTRGRITKSTASGVVVWLRADSAKRLVKPKCGPCTQGGGPVPCLAYGPSPTLQCCCCIWGMDKPAAFTSAPREPKLVKTTCHFLTLKPVSTCPTRTHQILAP
jgi:hypothetical protein